jgi:murein L,D-transpeptidase YcbB/YkuD
MKNSYFLLALIAIGISSCKSKRNAIDHASKVPIVKIIPLADSAVATHIEPMVTHLDSDTYWMDGHFAFSNTVLPKAYKNRNYNPLWKSAINRNEAIKQLSQAWKHGLLPQDYYVLDLVKFNIKYDTLNLIERASYDVLLTEVILLYSHHLIRGKLDPETLSSTWNYKERKLPESTVDSLVNALKNESLGSYLAKLESNSETYKSLQLELLKYRALVVEGGWDSLSFENSIRKGDTSLVMPELRQRLAVEGYMFEEDDDTSLIYDKLTVAAIKQFQNQHGLYADGIIGATTQKVLNLTAEHKLMTLITNIERFKWMTIDKTEPHIKVNIAAFKLQYVDSGLVTYSSNVVVGNLRKQTPVFKDKMEKIVLNPTWTLPYSIATRETLRMLQRDSLYLKKHNMILLTNQGDTVTDSIVDWMQYHRGHFPFVVRQLPGPRNALGQVKFLFPNKYAIYLHDTPSKFLFWKEERAFSHGCIRLQNPLEFAQFILNKQDTLWTMDSIQVVLDSNITQEIKLENRIPIYLLYQTADVNARKEVIFYQDIYGRDERIYRRLMNMPEK